MFDAIIVSGGNIQKDFALDFLKKEINEKGRKNILLIAADKGLDFFIDAKLLPDIAVGDFDSLSEQGRDFLEKVENSDEMEIIRLKPEKDDSDTQSALMLAKRRGAANVVILGATGSRLDHVAANLGLLLWAKEQEMQVVLVDKNNWISLVDKETILEKNSQFGKYVSFFPLGEDVENLTLEGFKYPLKNHYLKLSDSGLTVSNEIDDNSAKITYTKGNLLMIMSRD